MHSGEKLIDDGVERPRMFADKSVTQIQVAPFIQNSADASQSEREEMALNSIHVPLLDKDLNLNIEAS